jgi:endonuclease/exonuclease/phosphatase family metal-dependent hydrolase
LEKIAASADIPMLVCGDFNSIPGRSVHFYDLILVHLYFFLFSYFF